MKTQFVKKICKKAFWIALIGSYSIVALGKEGEIRHANSSKGEKEVTWMIATADAAQGKIFVKTVLDADSNIIAVNYLSSTSDTKGTLSISDFRKGATLYRTQGRDVVKISSSNISAAQGGTLDVRYLKNGITNQHGNAKLYLEKSGKDWSLLCDTKSGRKEINKIHFQSNKTLGQTVGIKQIVPSFDPSI